MVIETIDDEVERSSENERWLFGDETELCAGLKVYFAAGASAADGAGTGAASAGGAASAAGAGA